MKALDPRIEKERRHETIREPGCYYKQDSADEQQGDFHTLANSLRFEAQQGGAGALQVSLGGEDLTLFALSNGPNYTRYVADISAFAGQTQQLTFSALEVSTYRNDWNIDNIQFSTLPAPEPGIFGLSAVGALVLGWRALRRRR